jgi:hypothetical protein
MVDVLLPMACIGLFPKPSSFVSTQSGITSATAKIGAAYLLARANET